MLWVFAAAFLCAALFVLGFVSGFVERMRARIVVASAYSLHSPTHQIP